ncbi:glycosyltransferase family 10 domain-containing protein [Desulfopila inferna]|uniref:glycosyltransferase family 10 domain-containing protein n=1 Tax=Desulfopila inferna TaxID=468528 RepID=UPI0019662C29|nr:glycosyltransferase family 10 [Desulfopila inferna]MBM9604850.1 hypothetical protein [Desulfopila inferna]
MIVKFMHRGFRKSRPISTLLRQFPGMNPVWGHCSFIFDADCRDYDWLVVYHDLPRNNGLINEERLACPRERTMLLTGEPSTITVYGTDYLRQFGCIVTFQEPWAIRHPQAFFRHPGLTWFYGITSDNKFLSWDELVRRQPGRKDQTISTVCSSRTGTITLHSKRVAFTNWLKEQLPELEIFGHGVRPMKDKAEALDPFRYHIAVENHVYDHHLTEKLPDAFLGYCLPFYHGAPNAADYFPEESFVLIDINDRQRTFDIIRSHIANNEYEDRLPYIREARRRILEEQNLFAVIADTIEKIERRPQATTYGKVIRNRSTMRLKNPIIGLRSLSQKGLTKFYHRLALTARRKLKWTLR